jgi:hypothetical protein
MAMLLPGFGGTDITALYPRPIAAADPFDRRASKIRPKNKQFDYQLMGEAAAFS